MKTDCGCEIEVESAEQASVLWLLLAINFAMFLAEFAGGWVGGSAALISDSFDMLADAAVYSVSLFAITRAAPSKAMAAILSGWLQVGLGLLALLEVARRLVGSAEPEPSFMIAVSIVALIANAACLRLIARHKDGGVHMRASFIFSQNDVIANSAVIVAGVLVALTSWTGWDLLVGGGVAVLVLSGGYRIIREARAVLRALSSSAP